MLGIMQGRARRTVRPLSSLLRCIGRLLLQKLHSCLCRHLRDCASLRLRSSKRPLHRRRRPAGLSRRDDRVLVLEVEALRQELDVHLRRGHRRPEPGLAHGHQRDGAHHRQAHAREHRVVNGATDLAVGFQRHRFRRLGLLGLERALRVRVRVAILARDRDKRRRRRNNDVLAVVHHLHRLLRVLGLHLLVLGTDLRLRSRLALRGPLPLDLLRAELLKRLPLHALLGLLAREERLHPLRFLHLLLIGLLLGLLLGLLRLHLRNGALAAPGLSLRELGRVLLRLALQALGLLARRFLLRALLRQLFRALLLRKLFRPLLLRKLGRALLLRKLRRALLLHKLRRAFLRRLGDRLKRLLHLALLLELGEKLVLLGLDRLGVGLRSSLRRGLHLRAELHPLHQHLRVLTLRRLKRRLALLHGHRVRVAHLQRHLERVLRDSIRVSLLVGKHRVVVCLSEVERRLPFVERLLIGVAGGEEELVLLLRNSIGVRRALRVDLVVLLLRVVESLLRLLLSVLEGVAHRERLLESLLRNSVSVFVLLVRFLLELLLRHVERGLALRQRLLVGGPHRERVLVLPLRHRVRVRLLLRRHLVVVALGVVLRRLALLHRVLEGQAHRLGSLERLLPDRIRVFLLLVHASLKLLLRRLHRVLALLDSHFVREAHRERVLILLLRHFVGVRLLRLGHLVVVAEQEYENA